MKTFYSLIKIAPNPASGDNLTIGIVLRDDKGFRYAFSKNKKNIAKNLLGDNSDSIDFIEKQITLKLHEINKSLQKHNDELYSFHDVLTVDYFSYLYKYCNGILQFTKPYDLHDTMDDEKFSKLFNLLVDSSEKIETRSILQKEKKFFSRVEEKLIKRVQGKVHTNQKFDSNTVHSLVTPFEMDCIGKNGVLIGAKAIPMTQSKQTISAHINSYMNVILHLSYKYHNAPGNDFYLISDEPGIIGSPEHKIWEDLKREELLKVINSEQADQVALKIEESNASTFLVTG